MTKTAQSEGAPSGAPVAVVHQPGAALAQRAADQGAITQRVEREDPLISAVAAFDQMRSLAKSLVDSGFLPRAINTPEKAIAVMLAGRELGVGPMIALRSIHIIDAKPVVAADLLLARFKADGGRATFTTLNDEKAVLKLRHPNGDEHVEEFTHAMAQAAGLLGKDNWKKHKKAMMRSRVITAGLKSVGYEPTAGVYTPDEAEEFGATTGSAAEGHVPPADDAAAGDTVEHIEGTLTGKRGTYKGARWTGAGDETFPYRPYNGVPLNAKYDAGAKRDDKDVGGMYVIKDERLQQALKWVSDKLTDAKEKDPVDDEKVAHWSGLAVEIERELKSRASEASRTAKK